MDRLEGMEVFVRIVEAGSLSAAARQMGSTQPTISKQLAALEHHLGARLLERSTRRIILTEAGSYFLDHCRLILEQVQVAEGHVGRLRSSLVGSLHIAGPVAMGQLVISPAVLAFHRLHPELHVELTLTDRFIDLFEESVDLAVRIGAVGDPELVARPLGHASLVAVAAPSYLEARGTPLHPGELVRHDCVLATQLARGGEWSFSGPDGEIRVRTSGRFRANSGLTMRDALVAGEGVGLMPRWLVHEALESGALVSILHEFEPEPLLVTAVYPFSRRGSAKLGAFVQHLQASFASILDRA